jgi:protease stability complex PrcB-like protein
MRPLCPLCLCGLFVLSPLTAAVAGTALPVRTLKQGIHCTVQKPERHVARTRTQYAGVWNRQLKSGALDGAPPPGPKVDFSKEMVLAVFMGSRPTGGYSIQIQEARVEKGKLRVTVVEKSPPPGTITTQALTSPFHFVAVKKSSLPVEWRTVRK